MKYPPLNYYNKLSLILIIILWLVPQFSLSLVNGQSIDQTRSRENHSTKVSPVDDLDRNLINVFSNGRDFRVEKLLVTGGAELITIFANLPADNNTAAANNDEVPLVSVLRDTLGDEIQENDRLRYIWVHSFTDPSLKQKLASGIPFFYRKVENKNRLGSQPPKPLIDLNPSDKNAWNKVFWVIFRQLALSQMNPWVRSATLQHRNNQKYARQTALMSALAVLIIFQSENNEKILSDAEMQDIHARIKLSGQFTGALVRRENYSRLYQKSVAKTNDNRGHNWELLRQYCDLENLYFEPLQMPDGSATHAIIWVSEEDLKTGGNKSFEGRFLNIKNPWKDARLRDWQGYKEVRFYDNENRRVSPDEPSGKPKTMIPLAVYGLDFPKIPALLVDFRNNLNPRRREMSKRLLNDITGNLLAVSTFGNLPYFFGRSLYDFVTARRGIDLNQASRADLYSQLKLLLLLDQSLDENIKSEIQQRIEKASINPLDTDSTAKIEIARRQYTNLAADANRPGGLPKKLENDRREEMVGLKHNRRERMLFAAANLFSLGRYKHREQPTEGLFNQLAMRRELDFHERFLRETAKNSSRPEIDTDFDAVKKSLAFISANGPAARGKTARVVAEIFNLSNDREIKQLALSCLNKLGSQAAKTELRLIYEDQNIERHWRNQSAGYLNLAPLPVERISADNEK